MVQAVVHTIAIVEYIADVTGPLFYLQHKWSQHVHKEVKIGYKDDFVSVYVTLK